MRSTRVQRMLLASFPPWHRARYGRELGAVTADCGGGVRVALDLARSSVQAWARPRFTGDSDEQSRRRLQATTATVFVAWSMSAFAVAVYSRAVDDQRVPGLASWAWSLFTAGSVVFEVTVAAALVVGFGFWLRVVVPALRSRDRSTLVSAGLPAVIVSVWLAVTMLVALIGRRFTGPLGHPGAGLLALLAAYASFTALCVVGCAVTAVRALDRASLAVAELRVAAALSVAATGSLALVTLAAGLSLGRVLAVGGLDLRNEIMAVGPVGFLAGAVVVCLTASARSVRLVRAA